MMQELVNQINKSARSATEDMHTALPGEIKSYDPTKGVATVLPKAKFAKTSPLHGPSRKAMDACWFSANRRSITGCTARKLTPS